MSHELTKSLGVFRGAALMLSIVIGAGLLTLPGIAIRSAGDHAFLAWVVCAIAALPLLGVFIVLGRRYPEAGGISAYARRAFGPYGARITSALFLGAVIFGLPSIALTGGHYLVTLTGGSAHVYALCLLGAAVLPHLLPGEAPAKAISWIASTVLVAIVFFLVAGGLGLKADQINTHVLPNGGWSSIQLVLLTGPFMMLFFAFTGWEVGAGIAEEFKNPQRDYPLAMVLSFGLATFLYLAIAYVAQRVDLTGAFEAPFVRIVEPVLGSLGSRAVAVTAALIIFANLAGAIWGVSRLVFDVARNSPWPTMLSGTYQGRPLAAVVLTLCALMFVVIADWFGAFGLATLLALAGQNFLILCGIAAASLCVLGRHLGERIFAGTVTALVLVLLVTQGLHLVYPASLVMLATVVGLIGRTRKASPVVMPAS